MNEARRYLPVKIFLEGKWVDKSNKIEVRNPYDNSVIDTVPRADGGDVERALGFAERGAKVMEKSAHEKKIHIDTLIVLRHL